MLRYSSLSIFAHFRLNEYIHSSNHECCFFLKDETLISVASKSLKLLPVASSIFLLFLKYAFILRFFFFFCFRAFRLHEYLLKLSTFFFSFALFSSFSRKSFLVDYSLFLRGCVSSSSHQLPQSQDDQKNFSKTYY